ncbi:MAG: SDR family NAD(P)-dependent oxidoreductase [Trueperaceae bacterium]
MESARVVLVTNVGQGFGRAVALAYGRAGYDVVCADRDVELASKTAAELEELGGQAIPIQADMTTQMDVLSAYQKVLEIFGALGGVVHLATQVSTTPFENLAEGEFFELMAEDVRSTFLVLKAAARLLAGGWVVVVAPPVEEAVQMHAVHGALRDMMQGFRRRYAYPRVNLVLPSRVPADPRHDQALVRAVRFLGSPESAGVTGQVVDVELPPPPRAAEALLPEVRAALDLTVRQPEDDAEGWDETLELGLDDEIADDGSLPAEADDDEALFEDHWVEEFGLSIGAPALRHLVADEHEPQGATEEYAAGHEPAYALYGDLSRLEGYEADDASYDEDGDVDVAEDDEEALHPVTRGPRGSA